MAWKELTHYYALPTSDHPQCCLIRNVASQYVLSLLNQPVLWLCGCLGPTGCSSSNLGYPSAPGICPHICFTVDSQGSEPRRASPLTTLMVSIRFTKKICAQQKVCFVEVSNIEKWWLAYEPLLILLRELHCIYFLLFYGWKNGI